MNSALITKQLNIENHSLVLISGLYIYIISANKQLICIYMTLYIRVRDIY